MFVWQHLLSAIIVGLMISFILKKSKNSGLLMVFIMMSAQSIDLDHFKGDPNVMVKCAFMTSCHDSVYPICQKSLDRGILHTWEFLVFLLIVLGISYIYQYKYVNYIFYFVLGIILHFILDFGPWKGC